MNRDLWNNIAAYDLDDPPSEYGFSIRLANENYWTKNFTDQAIVEYKKFMYLAATSNFMVSPSEVVDTVWHQHLIFTQSYQNFCEVLGKQIQHIPSTHNKEDAEKFKLAKERTIQLYEQEFGKQPSPIWNFQDMFSSLQLTKAAFNIRTFVIIGLLTLICLTVPSYFLLRNTYSKIDNPYFIITATSIVVCCFLFLEIYNRSKLKSIVTGFDPTSFVFDLRPFEMVFLKTQQLPNVINGAVNELMDNGTIKVNDDNSIELAKTNSTINSDQLQITAVLSELGRTTYPKLQKILLSKPLFWNTANCMNAFRKYFIKSKKFGAIFYTNFLLLSLLALLSFTRIVTGVLREKPVFQITMLSIILAVVSAFYLYRLTQQFFSTIIPNVYRTNILPDKKVDLSWEWSYFLFGTAVLTPSFVPLVNRVNNTTNSGDGVSSSCGSSCGSSCSSCGGCGGD